VRAARNIAIIAVVAFPVAFLPGGGNVASAVVTTLTLAFLATLGLAGRQLYRENRLTVDTLPDVSRAELLVAVGIIVLMIAGTDELLDTGLGTVLWIALLALSGLAIARIWSDAHSY
jgi:acetyl-CoA carboxylase beta subunit